MDDFDHNAIRRKIYSIYEQMEHVILSKLLKALQDAESFGGK